MKVYVLLFHDVWDIGEDGGPEDVSIEGVFATRAAAETAQALAESTFPDRGNDYWTIEEHPLDA